MLAIILICVFSLLAILFVWLGARAEWQMDAEKENQRKADELKLKNKSI